MKDNETVLCILSCDLVCFSGQPFLSEAKKKIRGNPCDLPAGRQVRG